MPLTLRTTKMVNGGKSCLIYGRLSYPHLFKAKNMPGDDANKPAKFSTTVILPKDTDLTALEAWIKQTIKDKWGDKGSKLKHYPILSHAEKTEDADLAANFPYLVRCASVLRPEVLLPNRENCEDENEAYGGRWALVSVRASPWEHVTGGRGVSLYLNNVVLFEHDDRLGSARPKASDEFGDIFDEVERNPDAVFNDPKPKLTRASLMD